MPKRAPRHRESCGSYGGYRSHEYHHEEACERCVAARRLYLASEERRQARSARYRSRSDEEADLAFARLRPTGKRCVGCSEILPMLAFARDRGNADGRHRYCTVNGCKEAARRDKRIAALEKHWRGIGLDPARCAYCLAEGATDIEHFVPRSLGGSDDMSNLFPSCAECNRGQGGKHSTEPFFWLSERFPDRVAFFQALKTV